MEKECTTNDFLWVDYIDPHLKRRQEILAKYPEIKSLFGHEPATKYIVSALIVLQILLAYSLRNTPVWVFCLFVYIVGATLNHVLYSSIHELTHNLAFKKPKANTIFALIANLPIGIPVALTFKRYHFQHHLYLGQNKDPDIPTIKEARFVHSSGRKFIWLALQPLIYSLRPLFTFPTKFGPIELAAISVQILFDFLIYYLFGAQALLYLVLSSILGMSLHPMAAHLIAEHFVVHPHQETYSYYGILTKIAFNVGYHVEHHDFPTIPWSRLKNLRQIAPEFYNDLYTHTSWPLFMLRFILDQRISLFSRIKRNLRLV